MQRSPQCPPRGGRATPDRQGRRRNSEELLALAVEVLAGLLVAAALLDPQVAAVGGAGLDLDGGLAVEVVLAAAGGVADDLEAGPVLLAALGEEEPDAGGPAVLLAVTEVSGDVGAAAATGVGAPRTDVGVGVVGLPLVGRGGL